MATKNRQKIKIMLILTFTLYYYWIQGYESAIYNEAFVIFPLLFISYPISQVINRVALCNNWVYLYHSGPFDYLWHQGKKGNASLLCLSPWGLSSHIYIYHIYIYTVYSIDYAHGLVGFCFVLLWLYYLQGSCVIDSSISFRVASLALGQSYDCPCASEVILKD